MEAPSSTTLEATPAPAAPAKKTPPDAHYQVLVVGGGTAGLTVAARLRRLADAPTVAVVEPSETHYYQPLWTLVGGGVFSKDVTERREADYIPPGVVWVRDAVLAFDPEANTVATRDGRTLSYDALVVAPGIEIDWEAIPGLTETLGRNGVCSNYSYAHVEYTWEAMQALRPGARALFTQPSTPIKCGGAPQKIMYLTADHLRRRGILDQVEVAMFNPGKAIFGVPEFRTTLEGVNERYGITWHFGHELIAVRGDAREAVIRVTGGDGPPTERVERFDLLHVVPPQRAPAFVAQSPLANAGGWVDVDRHTLQHVRYPNVFALGDAAGTPNAKTGAAVRKQAPVVVENLMTHLRGAAADSSAQYDGYSSCPLVTGYGRLVLAEFDYDNRPAPSFPFDTTKERRSMYALKKYGLPLMYWRGMLRGRM